MSNAARKDQGEEHSYLLWLAASTLFIYLIFVRAFPLIASIISNERTVGLEKLMREQRWFAAVYVLGILSLYYLFVLIMRHVRDFAEQQYSSIARLKKFILLSGFVFGTSLIFLYPITAIDIFIYVVRGRIWAIYGESPFLVSPDSFPNDPLTGLAGEYVNRTTGYGPLWEIFAQVPLRLGASEAISGVMGIKILILLAYLGTAALLGWFAFSREKDGQKKSLLALTFYAWNPLVLIQGLGNGHNDILMLFFITLGLVLWMHKRWLWAVLALTLAVMVKSPALLVLPVFAVATVRSLDSWPKRIVLAFKYAFIFFAVSLMLYLAMGPLSEVLKGVAQNSIGRKGYSPVFFFERTIGEIFSYEYVAGLSRGALYTFALYYGYLLLRLWTKKLDLLSAAYLAFFGQLILGTTFRIWYPLWLIPLAALKLTSATFWRTAVFSLTAELSVLFYSIIWVWFLMDWTWGLEGPLSAYWNFWTVTIVLTIPWVFGLPIVIPMILERRQKKEFPEKLLI